MTMIYAIYLWICLPSCFSHIFTYCTSSQECVHISIYESIWWPSKMKKMAYQIHPWLLKPFTLLPGHHTMCFRGWATPNSKSYTTKTTVSNSYCHRWNAGNGRFIRDVQSVGSKVEIVGNGLYAVDVVFLFESLQKKSSRFGRVAECFSNS